MSDRQRHGFVLLSSRRADRSLGVRDLHPADPARPRPARAASSSSTRASRPRRRRSSPRTRSTGPSTSCASASTSSASPSRRSRPRAATRSRSDCPTSRTPQRAEQEVGTVAQLYFYDWEANALTPNGKTVASQLRPRTRRRPPISQGAGSAAPGEPGRGQPAALPGGQARLQAAQVGQPAATPALGPQYYLFGAPGSAACAAEAKASAHHAGGRPALPARRTRQRDLRRLPAAGTAGPRPSSLPAGVHALRRPGACRPAGHRGAAGRQAQRQRPGRASPARRPSSSCSRTTSRCAARTSPTRSRAPTRPATPTSPFGFSSKGKNEFQNVTAAIAHRGQHVGSFGQALDQHFAVALDNQLITVPSIDFKTYPDGIPGDSGADITGGFTIQSAQDLANELRLGALPINLKLISESQVSATLGKQALHQGLIAGARGPDRGGAVPDHLLPRAGRDRGRGAGRLRPLLLRADQADPDHADAARDRRV